MVAVIGAAAALVTACTSSASPAPTTSTNYQTVTSTRPPKPPKTGTPVPTGPTSAADAPSCPLLNEQFAAKTVGMRLEKISVLKSGGHVVGCRIYALQHPNAQCDASCLQAEKLPPGNQPAVEITSARYRSPLLAHNAFVMLAKKGKNIQQAKIAPGNVGLCYQTDFYAKDHGTDWACAYSIKSTVVVVKTVVTSPALNAILVAKAVAPKF